MHLFPEDGNGRPLRTEPCTLKYIGVNDGASRTLLLSENVDAGFWTDVAESQIGFVWEATLVADQPAPVAIARINRMAGNRWQQVAAARNLERQQAMVGLACANCFPGPPLPPPSGPLPPWDTPIGDPNDPAADPPDPQPYVDEVHRSLQLARPSSYHPQGVIVTFADGRSQFLNEDIDYLAYCQMMSTNDSQATLAGSIDPVPAQYTQSRAQ